MVGMGVWAIVVAPSSVIILSSDLNILVIPVIWWPGKNYCKTIMSE